MCARYVTFRFGQLGSALVWKLRGTSLDKFGKIGRKNWHYVRRDGVYCILCCYSHYDNSAQTTTRIQQSPATQSQCATQLNKREAPVWPSALVCHTLAAATSWAGLAGLSLSNQSLSRALPLTCLSPIAYCLLSRLCSRLVYEANSREDAKREERKIKFVYLSVVGPRARK